MRNVVIVLILLLIVILTGCTSVTVDKPDGTKVTVTTWGSSQVTDMQYDRDADGIVLKIGSTSNTPEGMPEVIEAAGKAVAAGSTAGISGVAEAVIANSGDD